MYRFIISILLQLALACLSNAKVVHFLQNDEDAWNNDHQAAAVVTVMMYQ